MNNLLVTNVYSYKNKGDAAIVLALMKEIKRVLKPATITIQTADVHNDKGKYGEDAIGSTLLWSLLSQTRDAGLIKRLSYLFGGCLGLSLFVLIYKISRKKIYSIIFSKEIKQYLQQIFETDLVIACGGGYLRTADSSVHNTLLFFITGANFLVPRLLGRKVILYSQSIGPVYGLVQKIALKFFLNHVNLILVREQISYNLLTKLEVKTLFYRSSDPVFILKDSPIFETVRFKINKEKMAIGITVRAFFSDKEKQNKYEESLSTFVDYLYEQHNAETYYFPQVIADHFGDDDRESAERVKLSLKHKSALNIIDLDLHPFDLINFAGEMDFFVGTRMHSNIFALIAGTPVLAIEYEHKSRGIMRDFRLEDYVISIGDVTPNKLINLFTILKSNQDKVKEQICEIMPSVILKSQSAMDNIKQYLSK